MSTKVKVTLTDSWMYLGTTYLPGVHTLDESIANILVARGATTDVTPIEPTDAELAQRIENLKQQVSNPATPNADSEAPNGEPPAEPTLESVVGSKAAASLAAAGYTTYGDAIAADDATLSAIDGIGEATIKKLREYKAA